MRIPALRRRLPQTLQNESSGPMGEPHSGQYEPAPGSSSTFLKTPNVASPGKHRNRAKNGNPYASPITVMMTDATDTARRIMLAVLSFAIGASCRTPRRTSRPGQ